ncbi:TerC family protein [Reyranella sp.]|uniref:TerC family protein n=1 Tax=Reyranella sp. TaxID=1929291 RepID=UPI002F944C5E
MVFVVPDLSSAVFWAALWKIIVANIILSGDNAVVIAMACHNLSDRYRKPAILFGSAGAIGLRIVFCAVIGLLLAVPYLKLVGGALLLWIGIKLLIEEDEEAKIKAHDNIWAAIWTIIVADAVMSLDNAIAIAAAAKGDFTLIVIGLVISIPIIVLGATLISRVLDRFPWLGLVGAGLIGWIAGEVMAGEGRLDQTDASGRLIEVVRSGTIADWLDRTVPHAETVAGALGAGLVLVAGLSLARLHGRRAEKN